MEEALFRLGPEGIRLLERQGQSAIRIHRRLPKQREHFLGVNEIRIAAEVSFHLTYFFAYWELPSLKWQHPIFPDAIFSIGDRAYAVEFDRGQENIQFFVRTKIGFYRHGLQGFPIHKLLIVTDRQARLKALAKSVGVLGNGPMFTTIDQVREFGLAASIFLDPTSNREVALL